MHSTIFVMDILNSTRRRLLVAFDRKMKWSSLYFMAFNGIYIEVQVALLVQNYHVQEGVSS